MTSAGEDNEAQNRQITIRFPHVDHAGIMFYPRYIELLQANFPDLPLFASPANFHIEFLRPNRLGDRIDLALDCGANSNNWTVTGRMKNRDYFVIKSANEVETTRESDNDLGLRNVFSTADQTIGDWAVDQCSRMFLSRYFEMLNIAVEEWFEDTLQMPFCQLHVEHAIGIPTVTFFTRCRVLPKLGDAVNLALHPIRIGGRSMTAKSCLFKGDQCLVETEQTIVFVRMLDNGYESVAIPDTVRAAFESRLST